MTTHSTDIQSDAKRSTARLAGLLYFLLVVTGMYGLMYAPSQIVVKGDAAVTLNQMLAHELVFRLGIASNLVSQVLFLFLAMTLYRLLRSVNEHHAKLMVALVITSVAITFASEALHLAALTIAKGDLLPSLTATERPEYMMLFLKLYSHGILVVELFWGLWLIPFGWLFYKSDFIPRILGILLISGGVSYVLMSLTSLTFPANASWIGTINSILSGVAEIATMLWLLIKGVKTPQKKAALA